MDTAQPFFRTRHIKNAENVLAKVQGYLAALLHNGQIAGDHTPMAKISGGYLVTASLPETDAPLRCGACFGPVALYKVPSTNEAGNHQDLLWWQDTYRAMGWLFIGTGPGERFAHDQLSRFDSEQTTDRESARSEIPTRSGTGAAPAATWLGARTAHGNGRPYGVPKLNPLL